MTVPEKIPAGYHSIAPYLIVDNADAAIAFYKKAFAAEEVFRLVMPDGSIGHAEIRIGNSIVMLGNESPAMGFKSPRAFGGSPASLHLYVEDSDATFAQAVAAGATSLEQPEVKFWGDKMGKVECPFGYQWAVSTHVEEVSMEEMQVRLKKLYG
jgi:PhnB protein